MHGHHLVLLFFSTRITSFAFSQSLFLVNWEADRWGVRWAGAGGTCTDAHLVKLLFQLRFFVTSTIGN